VERIFWVTCPNCDGHFYADYELRHSEVALECPFCHTRFAADESPSIDDRAH
jgi:hypothetical protein